MCVCSVCGGVSASGCPSVYISVSVDLFRVCVCLSACLCDYNKCISASLFVSVLVPCDFVIL